VTQRFEAVIKAELEGRGIKEAFRFDPKLKDTGLLDLKNLAAAPDKVPKIITLLIASYWLHVRYIPRGWPSIGRTYK
jgi:hypothetical protein